MKYRISVSTLKSQYSAMHADGGKRISFLQKVRNPVLPTLVISKPEHMRARVIRSSSCTVRLVELDLEVNPGSASTGYVSNVEGVIDRFMDVIIMVTRQAYVEDSEMSDIKRLQEMHTTLLELKEDPIPNSVTLELLDPNGHSQIIHEDATLRELTPEEFSELPQNPEPPVFNSEDLSE